MYKNEIYSIFFYQLMQCNFYLQIYLFSLIFKNNNNKIYHIIHINYNYM